MKIFYALALLTLIACNTNKENTGQTESTAVPGQAYTPAQLNERIVALESSLEEPMLKAEAEIKVRGDRGNVEGVKQSAKAMEDSIQLRIDDLKKLSPVGVGGEDFKLVATRYFDYMKEIYTTYRQLAESKSEKEQNEKAKHMTDLMNAQPGVLNNLRAAQQKYAADNGFAY